jgi:uncharacterized protein (DUF58 family)
VFTRNGWWFAALAASNLALGLSLGYRELVVVGVALMLCLILGGLSIWVRPDIEIHREVIPARVSEDEAASGVLTVTNQGRRRCPPMQAVETVGHDAIGVSLPTLAAGASHMVSYRLPTARRGYYAVGPLRIGHSDPLRLVIVSETDRAEATLWVHPRLHRARPIPTGHTQELEGPTNTGAPRGGIAFHSLREYEPGDDVRLIHWRSTARTGTLMVRHTVITNEPRLLIVLDSSQQPYEGDSFEDAVRVAASLAVAGADHRFPTEFRTTGGLSGSIDPAGRGRTDVLDKLAAVQPSDDDPGLDQLIRLAARREQGVSLGVVTGQAVREKASAVGAVRGRYEAVTMIQVGERFDRPGLAVSGVFGFNVGTSADWAALWKAKLG